MKRIVTVLLMGLVSTAASAVDRPGQKFLLKASDLPKPYASPAVANNNTLIPRPPGVMPQAPKGFRVSIYAADLSFPRFPAVAPNGDVFVSERLANKITLLRDSKGTGAADQRFTFAEGLHNPSGVAVHDGYVYISDQIAIWRTPYIAGATQAGKLERSPRILTTHGHAWHAQFLHRARRQPVHGDGQP